MEASSRPSIFGPDQSTFIALTTSRPHPPHRSQQLAQRRADLLDYGG
jgi:hypothetical protein